MAETHVKISSYCEVHNPAVSTLPVGAGQTISQLKDISGKVIATVGQVPGTGVVHNNPA